jgi:hypothetical protein
MIKQKIFQIQKLLSLKIINQIKISLRALYMVAYPSKIYNQNKVLRFFGVF